jgi:hypothetical protein
VWGAEQDWVDLMAAIDCRMREITGWNLEARRRRREAISLAERAAQSAPSRPGV